MARPLVIKLFELGLPIQLQNSPNFLKSFQDYQNSVGNNSQAVQFLFLLLFVFGIALVIWIIYRLIRSARMFGRISNFRLASTDRLKKLALKKLTELRASVEQINVFFALMGDKDDYINVITNPVIFEEYLKDYSTRVKDAKKIEIAESLRNTFLFSFNNPDIPFSSTRMLPVKLTVRVYLSRGFKRVNYLSVVARNETAHFAILPPKRKGVWVNISNLKEVEIRVFREKDTEYQFFCSIKWQSEGEIPLVYLEHTNKLTKIYTRYFKRYQLELPCKIARIALENLQPGESIRVVTKDISKGGLGLMVPKDLLVGPGDLLQIDFMDRKNFSSLYGNVINYNLLDSSQQVLLNVEFTGITEVERLLIERFIKQILEANPGKGLEAGKEPASEAPDNLQ